jgi:hypothetical protein
MNRELLEGILNKICLDERVEDGIISLENNSHLDVLQEYLEESLSLSDAIEIRNRIVEGKYPERQAYNKDGILVTFPTPEYKQAAISRGTHFEQNPKKAQANIFQQPATGQQPSATPPQDGQASPTPPPQEPPTKLQPADLLPQAQQTSPETATPPASDEKDLKADAGDKPEVDQRTPVEKKEDAVAIQQILASAPASIDIATTYPKMEGVSYSLKEAKQNNFYEKNGKWYDATGEYVGIKWFCESTNKLIISK